MISVRPNPNIKKWFQVFSFGKFVDEFEKERKAIRLAQSLAKEHKQDGININGEFVKITNQ